jgi:hypothetical protein
MTKIGTNAMQCSKPSSKSPWVVTDIWLTGLIPPPNEITKTKIQPFADVRHVASDFFAARSLAPFL